MLGQACCSIYILLLLWSAGEPFHVPAVCSLQVLGRNLEGIVNAAMTLKGKMGDQFVSVEHLVLALADDTRFGEQLFKAEGLTKAKLDAAVKEVSIKVASLCCHRLQLFIHDLARDQASSHLQQTPRFVILPQGCVAGTLTWAHLFVVQLRC